MRRLRARPAGRRRRCAGGGRGCRAGRAHRAARRRRARARGGRRLPGGRHRGRVPQPARRHVARPARRARLHRGAPRDGCRPGGRRLLRGDARARPGHGVARARGGRAAGRPPGGAVPLAARHRGRHPVERAAAGPLRLLLHARHDRDARAGRVHGHHRPPVPALRGHGCAGGGPHVRVARRGRRRGGRRGGARDRGRHAATGVGRCPAALGAAHVRVAARDARRAAGRRAPGVRVRGGLARRVAAAPRRPGRHPAARRRGRLARQAGPAHARHRHPDHHAGRAGGRGAGRRARVRLRARGRGEGGAAGDRTSRRHAGWTRARVASGRASAPW